MIAKVNSLRETSGNKLKVNTNHNNKTGQVWSLDFITSVVIFMTVLIPLFFLWSHANVQAQQQQVFDEVQTLTFSISESLVRTKGLPEGWDVSSVNQIGLASEENMLNTTKVTNFLTMGSTEYNRTKGILTGGYDFFFDLKDLNGSSHGTIGSKPPGKMVIPIQRYCLYNGRITKLEFSLVV